MDLALLVSYIKNRYGIDLSGYKDNYLERRIKFRMKQLGIDTFNQYFKHLKEKGFEEIKELIDTVTINVTEFMRDLTPFITFMNVVLPDIANRKKRIGSKYIRFWSAGCSCGEEPYSIAICVLETLNDDWNFVIYATDIDEKCLKIAKEGVYDKKQLKNLKEEWINKYFEKIDNEKYKIKDFVKKYIRFKKHNLITEEPISKYLDCIFCRNVMIYFTEEQKEKVLKDFYDALVDGGYLIIGKSEFIPLKFKDKFECISLRDKIYRKV